MSFDVFVQGFKKGDAGPGDREGVLKALRAGKHKRSKDGVYALKFPDGSRADFVSEDLDGDGEFVSAAFHIQKFSKDLAAFMYEVVAAAKMVMLPAMDEPVVILTAESQKKELPKELVKEFTLVLARSGADVDKALSKGFGAWSKYRDQVTGDE